MIQKYKDVIFNKFKKAGSNISRIIEFKPFIDIATSLRTIEFKPMMSFIGRTIEFKPMMAFVGRVIEFKPMLSAALRTIEFLPRLSFSSYDVHFRLLGIPIYSSYDVYFTLLEEGSTKYTVNFTLYNYEDCDEEFINLNC